MTKTTKSEAVLSRRKMLGRIGILAAAGYSVPAFTTLSMAHASGTSGASTSGASASGASTSGASTSGASTSGASTSGASTSAPSTSAPSASAVEAACGPANPGDTTYDQCLIDNGFTV